MEQEYKVTIRIIPDDLNDYIQQQFKRQPSGVITVYVQDNNDNDLKKDGWKLDLKNDHPIIEVSPNFSRI